MWRVNQGEVLSQRRWRIGKLNLGEGWGAKEERDEGPAEGMELVR